MESYPDPGSSGIEGPPGPSTRRNLLAVFELLDLKVIGVRLADVGKWLKDRMDWWALDPELDADKYLPIPTRLRQALDEFAELVGEIEGDRIIVYALHRETSSGWDLIRIQAEWFQGWF